VKLGDSVARSRRRGKTGAPARDSGGTGAAGRRGGRGFSARIRGGRFPVAVAGLAVTGWLLGYVIATQVLFPAPPPPGDLFEVPDLRGLGLASATERLAGVGLDLGPVDSLQHPSVAAGVVLGQSPIAGQLASPETPITVTLSSGPQRRAVPDVLSLDEERARVVLETSGFVVTIDVTESEEPRGRVVAVTPPPDTVVALPARVNLLVSAGPPAVSMPLVLGLEQGEAEALLDSLGLVVSEVEDVFRFGRDQGIVVEQEPAAETELRRGSPVRLKVGRRGSGGEH
jgi:beta-lactam-binding protein with PASTA domain